MGRRPSPSHSIDRINVNGNYEPGNCRWATEAEQQRNRRTNRMITAFGKTQCSAAWAEETGLHRGTIESRLRLGWKPEDAVTNREAVAASA